MSSEICVQCKEEGTPWVFIKEQNGHICYDCHINNELKKLKEKFNAIPD